MSVIGQKQKIPPPYTFCLRGVVIRLTDCESATNATVTVGRSESDCSCSLVLI